MEVSSRELIRGVGSPKDMILTATADCATDFCQFRDAPGGAQTDIASARGVVTVDMKI
jgi:hypothetical protein